MSLDERLFTLLNREWTSPVLDWWAALVRAPEVWAIPAVIAFALIAWRGSGRVRATAVLALLVFVLGDALIVRTGKLVLRRPRPIEAITVRSVRLASAEPRILALGMPLDITEHRPHPTKRDGRSFPSGHAWNSFAVATIIALSFRRWGWIAFLVAGSIGVARIHAGLHWPSDIALSAMMSVPATIGLAYLIEAAWRRVHPRLARRWPRLGRVTTLLPWRRIDP